MSAALQVTVTSDELSTLLSRAYDAGYCDAALVETHDLYRFNDGAARRAHRLFELIRDWSFERRLRAIAAADQGRAE
jgi:hypothetical protein